MGSSTRFEMALKIISVVGARPNFVKIAPFLKTIAGYNQSSTTKNSISSILVHTGQHYHLSMSHAFFRPLGIPEPDVNLEVGSGSQAEQVGNTMIAFEKVLYRERPDWVVVVGDVNATLACALTARKEGVKVCHIEAGLRSRDMTMPEEINRLVTDCLADLLLTPDRFASENLRGEGMEGERIRFVGNIMIDTLENNRSQAKEVDLNAVVARYTHPDARRVQCRICDNSYALMTVHRPSNVDASKSLQQIASFLCRETSTEMPVIWPIHPRSEKKLKEFGLWGQILETNGLVLLTPVGYLEMLRLNMGARLVLTDSGGLQEECTVLGTPCLTLRSNTERPITLREFGGSCVLVGSDIDLIRKEFHDALDFPRRAIRPDLWDGHTAERCLQAILS